MKRILLINALLVFSGCSSDDSDAASDDSTTTTGSTGAVGDAGSTTTTEATEDTGAAESSGDGGSTGPGVVDTDADADSLRGVRTCELNELYIAADALWMRVWNEVGLHDCPDDWLAAIDADAYGVGGPRWRSVDTAVPIDGMPELGTPEEVPPGLGVSMVEAAAVELFPLSALEMQLGLTIETFEDIPAQARRMLLDATLFSPDYVVTEVERVFTTEFTHRAGQRVFILDDGQCRYAMKYYTSVVDPDLVDEDAVATLGDRFTQLPESFTFSVETFDEDLVIVEDAGLQYVLTDEFGNSYDRFECD